MELTLSQIYKIAKKIDVLISEKMPIKTSYKIMKIAAEIEKEYKIIEQARLALVTKYSDDSKKVDDDKINEFHNDFFVLLEDEVEIDIDKIDMDDLVDIQISAIDLQVLEPIISI